MPEGSKVEKLYKKLRGEGHSEESAARIAQSVTGEALATGKPPRHENVKAGDRIEFGFYDADRNSRKFTGKLLRLHGNKAIVETPTGDRELDLSKDYFRALNQSFQNGRLKAEREIGERIGNAWLTIKPEGSGFRVYAGSQPTHFCKTRAEAEQIVARAEARIKKDDAATRDWHDDQKTFGASDARRRMGR